MPPVKRNTQRSESQVARWLDLFIQTLIVLSLLAYSVETLPDLPPGWREGLKLFETVSVIVFTIEYLVRVYTASPRLGYIFSE